MNRLSFSVLFLLAAASLVSAACTDSDGGIYPNVKGTASNSTMSLTDYCLSSSVVQEYYCSPYTGGPSNYGYGSTCDSGRTCVDGACVTSSSTPTPTPTPTPVTCSDTDGGIAIYVKGTAKLSNESVGFSDYCLNSLSLAEYYCSGNTRGISATSCANGCSNGVCLNASSTPTPNPCTDSDGGQVYSTKGTTSSSSGTSTDYCLNSQQLQEYYCNYLNLTTGFGITCTDKGFWGGCSDGRCLSTNSTPTPSPTIVSCTNSDSPDYPAIFTAGNVTYVYSNGTSVSRIDYCGAGTYGWTLYEQFCSGNAPGTTTYTCPSGYACNNGACTPTPTPTPNPCTDSDGGQVYSTKGTTSSSSGTSTDYCLNSQQLQEYYCNYYNLTTGFSITCTDKGFWGGCSDGRCLSTNSTPTPTPTPFPGYCTDSDGGSTYVAGSVNITGYINGVYGNYSRTDFCNSLGILVEYSCIQVNGVFGFGASELNCPTGYFCSNGACVQGTPTPTPTAPPSNVTCSDSDGGINYNVKGSVSLSNETSASTDYCGTSQLLIEYYCAGSSRGITSTTCSGVCSNGACVNTTSTPTPTPSVTCTDSDGGWEYYLRGTTANASDSFVDFCINMTSVSDGVREHACEGSRIISGNRLCPTGCLNGACITPPTVCTDSDGGVNFAVKGTVNVSYPNNGTSVTWSDSCVGSTLYELSCSGIFLNTTKFNCSQGCVNGACVNATGPLVSTLNTFSQRLRKGWNLVGAPFSDSVVSGSCVVERQWFYDAPAKSYVKQVSSETGRGKWLKVAADCDLTYSGNFLPEQSLKLYAGWNLVSVQNNGFADPAGVRSDCQVTGGPWAYENGKYYKSYPLKPGQGYWIRAKTVCSVAGRDASAITGKVVAGNAVEKILGNILKALEA